MVIKSREFRLRCLGVFCRYIGWKTVAVVGKVREPSRCPLFGQDSIDDCFDDCGKSYLGVGAGCALNGEILFLDVLKGTIWRVSSFT